MKRLRVLRRWFARRVGYARLLCLALLIGFAALRAADPAPVEEIRVRTFDAFQRIEPRKKTIRPVTIVDIDDKSLEKLGQWPWPRTRIADLVTELTRLGAVVIAFDAVFSEPDRLNPAFAADTFRHLDEETRAKLRALPSNDQIFADAIKASRVVLGESGLPEEIAPSTRRCRSPGIAMLGEEPQRFMFDFPACCATCRCWSMPRRARPVHDQARARRHHPARADDHAGAGPDHALADIRDVARRQRIGDHPDQGRSRRHQEHRRQGVADSDRP
jgi:hypothetical protein